MRVAFMERAGDEEDDVVDHVGVCNIVEEGGEGFDGIRAEKVELVDEELRGFVVYG